MRLGDCTQNRISINYNIVWFQYLISHTRPRNIRAVNNNGHCPSLPVMDGHNSSNMTGITMSKVQGEGWTSSLTKSISHDVLGKMLLMWQNNCKACNSLLSSRYIFGDKHDYDPRTMLLWDFRWFTLEVWMTTICMMKRKQCKESPTVGGQHRAELIIHGIHMHQIVKKK